MRLLGLGREAGRTGEECGEQAGEVNEAAVERMEQEAAWTGTAKKRSSKKKNVDVGAKVSRQTGRQTRVEVSDSAMVIFA